MEQYGAGEKIPIKVPTDNKVPLLGQLPDPYDRLYYNQKVDKPKRKLSKLEITFGKLTK